MAANAALSFLKIIAPTRRTRKEEQDE